jgi:hypothetical protein
MTPTPKTITAWVDRDGRNTFEAGQLLPKGWQGNFISEEHVEARIAELEAKLAKAVNALIEAANDLDDYSPLTGNTIETHGSKTIRATLAELKGGDV